GQTAAQTASGDARAAAQAKIDLGTVLAKSGKLPEAEAELKEAARLAPANASIHKNLGVVLARQGELEDAGAQFEEAVRLEPTDEGSRKTLEHARSLRGGGVGSKNP